jgi:RND family efflux transporter MFP subunit
MTHRTLKSFFLVFLIGISLNTHAQQAKKIVVITKPSNISTSNTLSLTGSFSPVKHSALSSRVDGLIKQLNVDIGDEVKQGDALMQLDATLINLSIAEQKALVEQTVIQQKEAQRLVDEAKRLLKQRHISATELAKREAAFAQYKAEVVAVKAALASAQETRRRHTLFAPFDGVISQKQIEVGEWVSRGDAVLTLTSLDRLYLDIYVPQEHFADIGLHTAVTIYPDTNPKQKIDAEISKIIPISDKQSRSLLVRVEVAAAENNLIAGTSASVDIHLANNTKKGFLVPRDALLIHPDGGRSIFIIDDNNIAHRRIVNIGQANRDGILILSGINANDRVVTRGNEVLKEGDHVITEATH